ncbi:MAG: DUF3276 family protein [Bacteroidetes bacterium]|nr:MAG: DUF3276 family protein [Bacteroidota bacterium]
MQGRDEVYSEKIRAGKRTYFFDVRSTRSNDYYITITESKRRFNGRGYDKHKIFLYKEDFNKFIASLNKTVDYVKSELMPDYDYDEFDRKDRFFEEGEPTLNEDGADQSDLAEVSIDGNDTLSTSWDQE